MSRDAGRSGNEKQEEAKGEQGRRAAEGKKHIGPFLPSSTYIKM